MKKRVLFLCTGNSCRSHMAEGLTNWALRESWQAYSAGTEPSGYVHPMAMEVMAEVGVSLAGHLSKSVEAFRHQPFDLVVTVCDSAAKNCPLWLGSGRVVHISFPDPAQASGSYEVRLDVFRQVRDAMWQQIVPYLKSQ